MKKKHQKSNRKQNKNFYTLYGLFSFFAIFGIYFATGTNVFHVATKMVMNGLGVYTEEISSVLIESDDYDQAGSYHIEKSAKWIDTDKARVTFDVDSVIKQEDSSMQDVILVLDISGSMMGSKLEKAISDSKELASYLLSNRINITKRRNKENRKYKNTSIKKLL